jgi:hypothetical protein
MLIAEKEPTATDDATNNSELLEKTGVFYGLNRLGNISRAMFQLATAYPNNNKTFAIAHLDNDFISETICEIENLDERIAENNLISHHTPWLTRFVNESLMISIQAKKLEVKKVKDTRLTAGKIIEGRRKSNLRTYYSHLS